MKRIKARLAENNNNNTSVKTNNDNFLNETSLENSSLISNQTPNSKPQTPFQTQYLTASQELKIINLILRSIKVYIDCGYQSGRILIAFISKASRREC